VIERVKACATRFKNPVIACLGLTFKADVDDLRESPAMDIVHHLAGASVGRILVVEPHVTALPPALAETGIGFAELDAAVTRADVVVLLVNHREFVRFDRSKLEGKAVIDTRGIWR
jgi:UDP-N-acetyl-D-mannosaminuronic acid dehydrogenase